MSEIQLMDPQTAYYAGFEAGGRIERERADFLEAEVERLRALLSAKAEASSEEPSE